MKSSPEEPPSVRDLDGLRLAGGAGAARQGAQGRAAAAAATAGAAGHARAAERGLGINVANIAAPASPTPSPSCSTLSVTLRSQSQSQSQSQSSSSPSSPPSQAHVSAASRVEPESVLTIEQRRRSHSHARRLSSTKKRRSSSRSNWSSSEVRDALKGARSNSQSVGAIGVCAEDAGDDLGDKHHYRHEQQQRTRHLPPGGRKMSDAHRTAPPRASSRFRTPWSSSVVTLAVALFAVVSLMVVAQSFVSRQVDTKGCRMSYMRPAFAKLHDFDTEHTRFASKYSLFLYREQLVDEDTKVKGVPVLFIPGNAGSYKQVRPIAAEAATYFHDVLRHDPAVLAAGTRSLDFFTVDFNEEFTAFHGQAILDQAEYLNEAVAYILSLYHDPSRSQRDAELPDPTSVIILGHSMGGIVARTMLVMPNYQSNSINTIITMAAPHARPPVSFDAQIVNIYKDINDYWRQAYAQKWANDNPLWHVTLLSIAGGGLDTMVPSDYASLESLVPETHGFTVFTSTVPSVWTGMDHQAILWCDQFRKVVVKALYGVVDVKRATQTKPRAERMRVFQRWFLTGMEVVAEKALFQKEPTTLLTLEDNSNSILAQGDRLVLRKLGTAGKPKAYLIPVPPHGTPGGKRFTLLTDQKLDNPTDNGNLEVLFCSVFPLSHGESAALFSMNMDLSGDSTGSTRLACKNAALDTISLPASTRTSKLPFYLDEEEEIEPFSYLQYDHDDIYKQDVQFVAVVEKATETKAGFVVAEFSDNVDSERIRHLGLRRLLAFGLNIKLPAERAAVMEIKIPALHSSLLAYHLEMSNQACGEEAQMFTPLIRQYLTEPYESKYFVNVKQASINLHGIAPFMPPPLRPRSGEDGISLQIWSDPTCNSSLNVTLKVDILGSFGKLLMRYRTMLAAFPLLIVALVLRKQFRVYDDTGIFISFSEAMDACLRRSLPVVTVALSLLAYSLASSSVAPIPPSPMSEWRSHNATDHAINFKQNDLLIGSQDPFFWFLVPFIGIVCAGVCVVLNYIVLFLTHIFCLIFTCISNTLQPPSPSWPGAPTLSGDRRGSTMPGFSPSTPRRRLITTAVLLFLVSTFIPYQFAYLVACLVQIATCTRALRQARTPSLPPSPTYSSQDLTYNFYNYAHSILILMLWTIPAINLPILVVWIHNLAVQWLTPFSSHHNVLSIMPFILLVETATSGKMVPRLGGSISYVTANGITKTRQVGRLWKHVTSLLFFGIAMYSAVYGVTYAYVLHHLVNIAAAWLVAVHWSKSEWSLLRLSRLLDGTDELEDRKRGKAP